MGISGVGKIYVHYRKKKTMWVSLPKGHGLVAVGDIQPLDVEWKRHDEHGKGWFFIDKAEHGTPVGNRLIARTVRKYKKRL